MKRILSLIAGFLYVFGLFTPSVKSNCLSHEEFKSFLNIDEMSKSFQNKTEEELKELFQNKSEEVIKNSEFYNSTFFERIDKLKDIHIKSIIKEASKSENFWEVNYKLKPSWFYIYAGSTSHPKEKVRQVLEELSSDIKRENGLNPILEDTVIIASCLATMAASVYFVATSFANCWEHLFEKDRNSNPIK